LTPEYLCRGPIVQTFTGTIIKQFQRDVKVALVNRTEIHALGEKLTQQAVGVLVAAQLPPVVPAFLK
jgi:hypothetical protein